MKKSAITHLFLDVGGVILTNGWDRHTREHAEKHFKLKSLEIEDRHHLIFEIYETGKITLDEYLDLVVFHQKRSFTRAQFKRFMMAQSKPLSDMLKMIPVLQTRHNLKTTILSNEGRELTAHRIKKFKLDDLADAFVFSCFVHLRKPDIEIFKFALDISQAEAHRVVYLDNTLMHIQVAESLGIQGVHHVDYKSTCIKLAELGLSVT